MSEKSITAAILVIGDEILSGRTKDKNIGYIAEYLTGLGIDLCEVRVVRDIEEEIVAAVNALRTRYTYLFTTGGIGPTHDDITADSIARALGVGIDYDERALAMMRERYAPGELNEARMRMARIPFGAELIANPISKAPGFMVENVITMAGVPSIMQAMLDDVATRLETGVKVIAETIDAKGLPEGKYAGALAEIDKAHPEVSIGSYPSFTGEGFRNQIVVRGRSRAAIDAAMDDIRRVLARITGDGAPA
ncbi:MAG: competence/damage-inducible protein A [Salinarimonas sp.]|nr:competence/damage-inducible protein A [Salinarimonas sp.]